MSPSEVVYLPPDPERPGEWVLRVSDAKLLQLVRHPSEVDPQFKKGHRLG